MLRVELAVDRVELFAQSAVLDFSRRRDRTQLLAVSPERCDELLREVSVVAGFADRPVDRGVLGVSAFSRDLRAVDHGSAEGAGDLQLPVFELRSLTRDLAGFGGAVVFLPAESVEDVQLKGKRGLLSSSDFFAWTSLKMPKSEVLSRWCSEGMSSKEVSGARWCGSSGSFC